MKKKVALIFGITGQDGSYLTEFLLKKNYFVYGVKRRTSLIHTTRIDHLYEDRHLNPKLWGDDADVFNPNRVFEEDELWNDSVFNTYNPNSERFSPFTFTPRDCLGKNFSQIEMRLILLHLCHRFSFELRDKFEQPNISMNYFTMGPRNINNKTLKVNRSGLFVRIHKRSKAKL